MEWSQIDRTELVRGVVARAIARWDERVTECERALAALGMDAVRFSPHLEPRQHYRVIPGDAGSAPLLSLEGNRVEAADHCDLACTVGWLLDYARTGVIPGDWDTTGEVLDAIQGTLSLVTEGWAAIEGAAAELAEHAADAVPRRTAHGDPDGDWPQVVLACLARTHLADDEGAGVPLAWLAALAGVDTSLARRLVSGGELKPAKRGRIDAADARRWLAARGVAGV